MKKWLRWRWGEIKCLLGVHDIQPDPDIPHVYWCKRPLCRFIDGGHP